MKTLKEILSSIYDPAYYKQINNRSLKSSLWYFFKLVFLLALIFSIFGSFFILPKFSGFITSNLGSITKSYPADLEVKIDKGLVSTNAVEPYFIPMTIDEGKPSKEVVKNLLVIDTKTAFDLKQFEDYQTIAWLGKDYVATRDSNNQIKIQRLNSSISFVVDKAKVDLFVQKLQPILRYGVFLIVPLILIFLTLFKFFGSLFYLIFATLLVWLVAKMLKVSKGYAKSYQIGLHAYTLSVILSFFTLFGILPRITFLPTVLLLIVVLTNLMKSK